MQRSADRIFVVGVVSAGDGLATWHERDDLVDASFAPLDAYVLVDDHLELGWGHDDHAGQVVHLERSAHALTAVGEITDPSWRNLEAGPWYLSAATRNVTGAPGAVGRHVRWAGLDEISLTRQPARAVSAVRVLRARDLDHAAAVPGPQQATMARARERGPLEILELGPRRAVPEVTIYSELDGEPIPISEILSRSTMRARHHMQLVDTGRRPQPAA